jgi:hypothetical protein
LYVVEINDEKAKFTDYVVHLFQIRFACYKTIEWVDGAIYNVDDMHNGEDFDSDPRLYGIYLKPNCPQMVAVGIVQFVCIILSPKRN